MQTSGRNLIYRANFKTMNAVLGYLTLHCCEGDACELEDAAAKACC